MLKFHKQNEHIYNCVAQAALNVHHSFAERVMAAELKKYFTGALNFIYR